jgi:polar amino acid transport system substrate-binding protein
MSQIPSAPLIAEIAPRGAIRAAINLGNPVLVQRDPATDEPTGVTMELAAELGRRLDLPIEIIRFEGAGDVVAALANDAWDIAFLAQDPMRANTIAFSPAYVQIEGAYLVPTASRLTTPAEVDSPGLRIAAGRGAAYELHLRRSLKHATLVGTCSPEGAFDLLRAGGAEAAAGIRQPLTAYARRHPGLRVLSEPFMEIRQAMCVPRAREAAARYVREFVEEMKASGFVARALAAAGQHEAVVPES